MHVFFESVWKLHIGEIPARPDAATASIRSQMDYAAAIAAIKQNALTVGNPDKIKEFDVYHGKKYKAAGDIVFVPWPGGYLTKEITGADEYGKYTETVAILTLPEEKKNTMENFTKEDLSDAFNAGATRMYHDLNLGNGNPPEFEQWFEKFSLYKDHPTTSSGSVAAPKEESLQWPSKMELPNHSEKLESENTALREAIKKLLPIAERKFNGISIDDAASHREYIALKAVIEKARKTISK